MHTPSLCIVLMPIFCPNLAGVRSKGETGREKYMSRIIKDKIHE